MFLIAGLGNPEKKYDATRHNIGRDIVSAARKTLGVPEFAPWNRGKARISEGRVGGQRLLLALPETGMNSSGSAMRNLARAFKIKPQNIFVVHDDADIALGRAKLSFAKHSAGHRGVESVIRTLGTKNFWRFRIGIAGKRDVPAGRLVLRKFTAAESEIVKKITTKTLRALSSVIRDGGETTMNEYNR